MRLYIALMFLCLSFVGWAQVSPFFFIQLTDTQLGMMDQNNSFDEESVIIEKVIEYINTVKPKFVVITGDLINKDGDSCQINEFIRLRNLFDKNLPIYIVPGNHDVGQLAEDGSVDNYKNIFEDDKFVATHQNTLLIGINSQIIWARNRVLEKQQFLWLEQQLTKHKNKRHKIIFAHHPIFVSSPDEEDRYQNFPIERRQEYFDLCSKYNVRFMFAGHLHRNNESKINNLNIISTNAVCVSHSDESAGFRIVKVYPDTITHQYHTLQNAPGYIQF